MTLLVARAQAYALAAHAEQRYGNQPYRVHLAHVAQLATEMGLGVEHQAAAWLHDVLEDTAVHRTDLQREFGMSVARLVEAVTGYGRNRRERQAAIVAQLLAYPAAIDLKLADRLANVRCARQEQRLDLLHMYRQESALYAPVLVQGNRHYYQQLLALLD